MYEINILPPKLRKRKKKIKIGNPTYAPFLLLAVLGTSFFMDQQLDARIESVKDEQNTIIQEIRGIEPQLSQISSMVSRIESLKSEFMIKEEAKSSGMPWDTVLDEISGSIPSEVTITSISEGTESGVIKIEAKTIKMKNMAKTKESFDKNEHFVNTKIATFSANTSMLTRPQDVTFTIMTTYTSQPIAGQPSEQAPISSTAPTQTTPEGTPTPSAVPTETQPEVAPTSTARPVSPAMESRSEATSEKGGTP